MHGGKVCRVCIAVTALKFLKMLKPQTVREGKSATFTCSVYPTDFPVKWMKDDVHVGQHDLADRYVFRADGPKRTLIIKSCYVRDAGLISARLGKVQSQAQLSVRRESFFAYSKHTL